MTKESANLAVETRLNLLAILMVVLLAAVVVKLFGYQVLEHAYYASLARSQRLASEILPAPRGQILVWDNQLKEYYPLATNVTLFALSVVPRQIRFPELTAKKLRPHLPDLSEEDLLQILTSGKLYAPPLKRKMQEYEAERIQELDLPGVYVLTEKYRYYPEGALAAHLLGFVNADRIGQYGVESFFEKELHGKDGFLRAERDTLGRQITLGERFNLEPKPGAAIVLTIDRAIQYYVERRLEEAVRKHGAKQGSVIIMDPKTGSILAMAAYPDFDPNTYNKTPLEVFTNINVSALYEPGSVFKVITMAAGLESGLVSPSTTYNDAGSVEVVDRVIKNSQDKVYGQVDMAKVLEQSINTGAVFVAQKLGKQLFYKYAKDFGLTEPTTVGVAGEVKGSLKPPRQWTDVDLATMSFGQGIALTPMELVSAVAAIAHGGKLMKPRIVSSILYPTGEAEISPRELRQVISPKTAQLVTAMMVNVIERGHGQRAGVPGYLIAGKTGTAQVPAPGGYDPRKTIGSFVGFGPVANPQFVMITRIDEPQDVQFAESSAAPLFGQIARFLLDYWQIPPTR